MKMARWIMLALVIVSCAAPLLSQAPPKREFRGAWLATVANLDWPVRGDTPQNQKNQLISLFDGMSAAGINAVIFQVRPECDALYASPYEPWSYALTGSQGSAPSPFYDPLQFAVDEAHRRGMELHAWFNPYRAERSVDSYALAGNHVVVQHPDWILTFAASGTTAPLKILNPGIPEVREFVARVVADIVRRYDVDGIHADDYFYPYPPQAITNQDDATFAAYPRGFTNRGDWRRDNVNLLMKLVRDSIAAIKPWVKFGMSPFGIWKNGVPPGITGLDAYSVIYGDAIAWLHDRSVDYLTPQLYWKIGGSQDYAALVRWWADSTFVNDRHLYPGMIFGSYTTAELPNQTRLNRGSAKVGGQVIFRASLLTANQLGFSDSLKRTFYTYPSLLPVMAWKDAVPPYMPRDIRFTKTTPTGPATILWDLPLTAPDGDSASRYAVYRFDHTPTLPGDLADARNMLAVVGARQFVPPAPPASGSYSYVVTALDRNYNESEPSNILVINPPAAPLLASPANGAVAIPESVTVVWQSLPLASAYHLQVSPDSAFASGLIVNDSTITDTSRIVRGYAGLTKIYWRVRAKNGAGASPFSDPFSFTSGFPPTVLAIYPANSMLDVPTQISLRWSKAEAATSYRLQCAVTGAFSPVLVDSSGIADTTCALPLLEHYKIYFWRIRSTNAVGTSAWTENFRFRTVQALEVAETEGVPAAYQLSQNFPNPFNPTTQIQFAVPHAGRVVLTVFDLLGREETTLVDTEVPAGTYTVTWDASNTASGMYFYRLRAGDFVDTKRMLLLR